MIRQCTWLFRTVSFHILTYMFLFLCIAHPCKTINLFSCAKFGCLTLSFVVEYILRSNDLLDAVEITFFFFISELITTLNQSQQPISRSPSSKPKPLPNSNNLRCHLTLILAPDRCHSGLEAWEWDSLGSEDWAARQTSCSKWITWTCSNLCLIQPIWKWWIRYTINCFEMGSAIWSNNCLYKWASCSDTFGYCCAFFVDVCLIFSSIEKLEQSAFACNVYG